MKFLGSTINQVFLASFAMVDLCFGATQLGTDIDGEAQYDLSGESVSLSADGSTVAIGAIGNDGNGSYSAGHVRIYQYINSSWQLLGADIDGEGGGFGDSVSLSSDGSTVAIGAGTNNSVRIYQYINSSWQQVGTDIDGEASGDGSGWSVSLSADGSTVAIGARFNGGNGSSSGHVRVYQYIDSSWVQLGTDIDGEAQGDSSGFSVSLSDDGSTVAIGAPSNDDNGDGSGHVRVYRYINSSWQQLGTDIDGEAQSDSSGYSVSLSSDGSTVAIGARLNDGNGSSSGHVRVYQYINSSWVQFGTDIDGEAQYDLSGSSVSLSADGSTVAIGALGNGGNGGNGSYSGHVRIYQFINSSWVQLGTDIDGEAAGDFSGSSVSLSADGSTVAIGANGNDGNGTDSGHVRVFSLGLSNDNFEGRAELGGVSDVVISGSLDTATSQWAAGEPDLSDYAQYWWAEDDLTVWYEWTAPAGVSWATFSVSGPNVPTVLSAYTGDQLPALSRAALNRRELVSLPNRVTFAVTPGTSYQIRVACDGQDVEYYNWNNLWAEPIDLNFELELVTMGSPSTPDEYVRRGRGYLQTGDAIDLSRAGDDFESALDLDQTHQEALFLNALTRLLQLESESASDVLLAQLGVTRNGALRAGGTFTMPLDFEGDPLPSPGSRSGQAIGWITDHFIPRLESVRANFDLITDNDFRTDLTSSETGSSDVYLDRGDILAAKAATHGLEMILHLIFSYDLDVSLETCYILDKSGVVDAETVLSTFTNLLEFGSSDKRLEFAMAMRAMQQDYLAAKNFILYQRGNPEGLISEGVRLDSLDEADASQALSLAVNSLDGEVDYRGNVVNLSRLVATDTSLRGFLPQFRGSKVVPDTIPDPTFDGILPGLSSEEIDNRIYQLEELWGMSQYAEQFGYYLEQIGLPGAPFSDADGDGSSNFQEWLRASDIAMNNVMWQDLTHNALSNGGNEVQLSFVRRKDISHWQLVVEVSDDLVTWDSSGAQIEMVGSPLNNGDGFSETVTYRLTDAASLAEMKFLRVAAKPKL